MNQSTLSMSALTGPRPGRGPLAATLSWYMVGLIHAVVGMDSPLATELRALMGEVGFTRVVAVYERDFIRRAITFLTLLWLPNYYLPWQTQEDCLNPPQQGVLGGSFIMPALWARLAAWVAAANAAHTAGVPVPPLLLPHELLACPLEQLLVN